MIKKQQEQAIFSTLKAKDKEKLEKFDARGIQTLFRTLSRNHYNLLRMVDNKASILLTINSFIVSAIMGASYFLQEEQRVLLEGHAGAFINFCIVSMIFAVISMLPHKYFGKRFVDSRYNGVLYAQNFSKMSLEDYRANMARVMNSGESLYDEMINDIYFLGRSIAFKQNLVILSFLIFLGGMIFTSIHMSLHN